jgi:hypothetical protein
MNTYGKKDDGNNKRDNLREINGIGPVCERDLHTIEVFTFDQIAEFNDAQQLHNVLKKSGSKIRAGAIENGDWIGQARAKIRNSKGISESENSNDFKQYQIKGKNNKDHAAFIVSFDRQTAQDGEECWSTVVSYAETDKLLTDFNIPYRTDPSDWLKWIFEDALEQEPPDLSETEIVDKHLSARETGRRINVVDVQVVRPSKPVPQKELLVQVNFELIGSEVETWIDEMPSCRLEIFLHDLERQVSELVTTAQKRFEPGLLNYEIAEKIPIPSPGRYELYVLLFPLPPAEIVVTHKGPNIKVIPHPVRAL